MDRKRKGKEIVEESSGRRQRQRRSQDQTPLFTDNADHHQPSEPINDPSQLDFLQVQPAVAGGLLDHQPAPSLSFSDAINILCPFTKRVREDDSSLTQQSFRALERELSLPPQTGLYELYLSHNPLQVVKNNLVAYFQSSRMNTPSAAPVQSSSTIRSSQMPPAQTNTVVSNTFSGQSLHVPPPPSRHLPLPLQVPPPPSRHLPLPLQVPPPPSRHLPLPLHVPPPPSRHLPLPLHVPPPPSLFLFMFHLHPPATSLFLFMFHFKFHQNYMVHSTFYHRRLYHCLMLVKF